MFCYAPVISFPTEKGERGTGLYLQNPLFRLRARSAYMAVYFCCNRIDDILSDMTAVTMEAPFISSLMIGIPSLGVQFLPWQALILASQKDLAEHIESAGRFGCE